jgi:hypothetical protein
LINREQNRAFAELLATIGESFATSPDYLKASDIEKVGQWKKLILVGEPELSIPGLAEVAREIGKQANPTEAARRSLRRN